MKRANVYFWDGFRFGPRIDTDDRDLLARLRRMMKKENKLPSVVSAAFIAYDLAEKHSTEVWNAPPSRTIGGYVTAAEAPDNWPQHSFEDAGAGARIDFPQAGVFILNTTTGDLRIIGGLGFSKSEDDCNPAALRESNILEDEE